MRKAVILLLVSLFFTFNGSAELNSTVAKSCPGGYAPVISMTHPNKTYNNPGTPEMYEYKVCVKGITDTRFGSACRNTPSFYLSSNTTHAHFSRTSGYNLRVCAGRLTTRIRDECRLSEVPLFSISKAINGFGRHIAGLNLTNSRKPNIFDKIVCGFYRPPENVSVSMEFNLSSSDRVYFDDTEKTSEFSYSGLAEFPYIVSTSGSHTAGLVAPDFKQVSRTLNRKNTLKLKRDAGSAEFFVPFTHNGYEEIENDQKMVLEGTFLEQIDPSFGFFSGTTPVVRTVLKSGVDIKSNLSLAKGRYRIKIEKTGEDQVKLQRE